MNKYLMLHYLYHMEWCREIPVCVLDFVSVCVCVCERGGGASVCIPGLRLSLGDPLKNSQASFPLA